MWTLNDFFTLISDSLISGLFISVMQHLKQTVIAQSAENTRVGSLSLWLANNQSMK